MLIALIEDYDPVSFELKSLLKKYGEVVQFEHHAAFLNKTVEQKNKYDIIVCDRHTGSDALDINGKTFAMLHRDQGFKNCLIILLSASFLKNKDTSDFDFVVNKTDKGYKEMLNYIKCA